MVVLVAMRAMHAMRMRAIHGIDAIDAIDDAVDAIHAIHAIRAMHGICASMPHMASPHREKNWTPKLLGSFWSVAFGQFWSDRGRCGWVRDLLG